MSKFNVGDVVNWTYTRGSWQGVTVVEHIQSGPYAGEYRVDCPQRGMGILKGCEIELVSRSGPIRTVTRREIVPGSYGDITIDEIGYGLEIVAGFRGDTLKPDNLREAAHILNQLAEALENGVV